MEDKRAVIQNLMDAGCDATLTDQFVSLVEQGREDAALALLAKHRKNLLERCHRAERKINSLDYLVYQMENKDKQGGN